MNCKKWNSLHILIIKIASIFVFTFSTVHSSTIAQCPNPYSLYPVTFDFENNDGGWVPGGSGSDWAWGHPSKQVISGAASGQNCWITGGLTGSSYNDNESSWLKSPNCFNFSNNPYPYIEFKIFWETEKQFDGAGFQYSTDFGATWKNVGALGDNTNCFDKNWFNSSVTYLPGPATAKAGWSGNIQSTTGICLGGGGSGNWVMARHELYALAGQPHVQFRFVFGSGSTCNAFDGFAVDDVTVSNTPPGPKITYTNITNAMCYGTATGSAVAGANYGVLPYTYSWTNGTDTWSGASVHYMPTGNYKLVVSDDNNCTDTYQFTITEPTALYHQVSSSDATCGQSNGSASITESGGLPPYNYAWSQNVASGASASSLDSGNYLITVTDRNNCIDTIHLRIDMKGIFSAVIDNVKDASCFGANDGSLTATVTGTGPFTYAWSPTGGSNAKAENLVAGIYKVLITDPIGCSKEVSAQVGEPTEITYSVTKQDATCNKSNGKTSVSVSGGQGGYVYLWMPGNYNTPDVTGLAPDTYTLTIKDAGGCSKTQQVVINSLSVPAINAIDHTDVLCNGQKNGTVTANVTGGTAPYIYNWISGTNTLSGNSLQNLEAGFYQLTVSDANGCTATNNVTISQPDILSHTVKATPITCTNPTGSATITEAGGSTPYTYLWSPSGGNDATASGLSKGDYVVNITDKNQCTDSAHIHITNTSAVMAAIGNVANVTCSGGNNGSATVTATGSGSFAYSWSPLGGNAATANTLTAGTYTVSVTDKNGCIAKATADIFEPASISIQTTFTATTCGNSNGSAEAAVSGGTSPYNYTWSSGNSSSSNVSSLSAGSYSVNVTDANGCAKSAQVIIPQSNPPEILSIDHTDALCKNQSTGSAKASVINGTEPYIYSWKNITNSFSGNPLQNIAAGDYELTVTDAEGCLTSKSFSLQEPEDLLHTISLNAATCGKSNGSANLLENGGTPPYLYAWSHDRSNSSNKMGLAEGDYKIYVSDSHQCTDTASLKIVNNGGVIVALDNIKNVNCFGGNTGSAAAKVTGNEAPFSYSWYPTGGNSYEASNLSAGNYTVTVTDQLGCTGSATTQITQRKQLKISIGNDTMICPGAEVILHPGTFTSYQWQDNSRDSIYTAGQTGIYSVTVTDLFGCTASASRKVELNCHDLLFPNAFTPNGDMLNDGFGPLGTLSAITNYTLRIYNRWGQPVFYSNNPGRKWKGTRDASDPGTGTFVWVAQYSFNGQPVKTEKGTILLIK